MSQGMHRAEREDIVPFNNHSATDFCHSWYQTYHPSCIRAFRLEVHRLDMVSKTNCNPISSEDIKTRSVMAENIGGSAVFDLIWFGAGLAQVGVVAVTTVWIWVRVFSWTFGQVFEARYISVSWSRVSSFVNLGPSGRSMSWRWRL